MKTKIIISREATITTEGKHINGNSEPVCCRDTYTFYPSMKDAAMAVGVSQSAISLAANHNTKCKGMRWCKASELYIYGEEMSNTAQSYIEDAMKWRELKAKEEAERNAEKERIEAERKAKEKREAEEAKIRAKIARRQEISKRKYAEYTKADELLAEAEQELEEFLNGNNK